MKLADLKEQHLEGIVRLFEEYCGIGESFKEAMYGHTPKDILAELKQDPRREYALASKWSMRTKLQFSTTHDNEIILGYCSNLRRDDPELEEAERLGQEFVKAAMRYLDTQ